MLEVVAADRFEQSIDEFLDGVLARLASEGVNEQDLLRLWGEILEERRDPQRANWRKAEAILGAAGEEPAELMRRMEEAATEYGRRAREEVAAHRMDEAPSHLSILASVESTDLPSVSVPHASELKEEIPDDVSVMLPWVRAERAASRACGGSCQADMVDRRRARCQ